LPYVTRSVVDDALELLEPPHWASGRTASAATVTRRTIRKARRITITLWRAADRADIELPRVTSRRDGG
jgi:hypothetical protein